MNLILYLIDLLLHLDKYLGQIIQDYGTWTYLILFFVIFMEPGFVITPFLPGDSLIFAAGAFAGLGYLHVAIIFILLAAAAIAGDTANYWIGHYGGARGFSGRL